MLSVAQSNEIIWIDTAQAYGVAEEVVGFAMPKYNKFRIISKIREISKPIIQQEDIKKFRIASIPITEKSWEKRSKHTADSQCSRSQQRGWRPFDELANKSKRERLIREDRSLNICKRRSRGIDSEFLEAVQLPISPYDQKHIDNHAIRSLYQ